MKRAWVLFLVGDQEAGLGKKLAALNNHRHHLCLRNSIHSGSRPCRHLGSPPGISRARNTPRNHMRPVDWDGTRPITWRGRTTRPTLRGYHHMSIHDSPLQTVGSWTTSKLTSEDWKSASVKFKIHLTLMCRMRPSGTNNSSNSSRTSTCYWVNNKKRRWPTGGPWDTILDLGPRASLGEDPRRGTCIFYFHNLFSAFIIY